MKNQMNVRNAALVAALATLAATAWAMNDSTYSSTQAGPVMAAAPAPAQPLAVHETLTPNEIVVTDVAPAPAPALRPVAVDDESVKQPPITIEQRRLTLDERIQSDVMDAVLHTPNITGKIGVESNDAVVTLTGWTNTSGQAYRAGRSAQGVQGVKYVDNRIRPRVGGSI